MKKLLLPVILLISLFFSLPVETASTELYPCNLFNDQDLQKYSQGFLKQNFNLDLEIPVTYGDIPQLGVFRYTGDQANEIVINKELLEGLHEDAENILIHELTHYALHQLDYEFRDGSFTFESAMKKFGTHSNYTDEELKDITFIEGKKFKSKLSGSINYFAYKFNIEE